MQLSLEIQRKINNRRTPQQIASKADSLKERIELCFMNRVNLVDAYRLNVLEVVDYAIVNGHECVKAKFYDSWEHLACLSHDRPMWKRVCELRLQCASSILKRPETAKKPAFANALKNLCGEAMEVLDFYKSM